MMDKQSYLATADDLLLDQSPSSTESSTALPKPVFSIALALQPPSSSTFPSSSSGPCTEPTQTSTSISILDKLEPNEESSASTASTSLKAEGKQDNGEEGGRVGKLKVEWIDFSTTIPPFGTDEDPAKTPTGPSDLPSSFGRSLEAACSSPHPPPSSLILRSGSTDLPHGVLHLFKHAYPSSTTANPSSSSTYTTASVTVDVQSPSSSANILPSISSPLSPSSSNNLLPPTPTVESTRDDGRLAAVLAVPPYFTPADFLAYVGRAEGEMETLRMIRQVSPGRSLVLIRFRSKEAAEDFITEFDGKLFNSFEHERCHVVRIKHVLAHFVHPTSPSSSSITDTPPPVETSPFPEDQEVIDALDGAVELPSCPVCLERLDSEISGLVTVQCDHRFHCQCLARWTDSRCPVCRYSQTATTTSSNPPPGLPPPPNSTPSSCSSCSARDSLWICLICGIVGCGRYSDGKHAQRHFESTGHLYALELETQRVWNYAEDTWVHRLLLLQTKTTASSTTPSSCADDDPRPSSRSTLVELPPSSTSTPTPNHSSLPPSSPSRMSYHQHPNQQQQHNAYPPPPEKLEALSLEYSHLLTSQLSAQRTYFSTLQISLETRVVELEAALRDALAATQAFLSPATPIPSASTTPIQPRLSQPSSSFSASTSTELKSFRLKTRTLERDLASERSLSSSLSTNLSSAQTRIKELEREVEVEKEGRREDEEQVRDLMFFLEARAKIEEAAADEASSGGGGESGGGGGQGLVGVAEDEGGGSLLGELAGGTVGVVVPSPTASKAGGGGKKKKRGGK